MEHHDTRWHDGLAANLLLIFGKGLRKGVAPATLTVLVELAEAVSNASNDGEPDYYCMQIENLLRKTFRRVETDPKRQLGLEKLYGIAPDEESVENVLGLESRRDDAAKLLGYGNKDTLRRGEVEGISFEKIVREDVLRVMLAIAGEHDFVFTERYGPLPPPSSTDQDDSQESSDEASPEPPATATPGAPLLGADETDTCRSSREDAQTKQAVVAESDRPVVLSPPTTKSLWWLRQTGRVVAAVAASLAGVTALVAALLFATSGSQNPPTYHDVWGPARPVYDYHRYIGNNDCADGANPSAYNGRCGASTDFPVFNSFINTPSYGDERAFFDGYRAELAKGHASDPVKNVLSGNHVVVLRIYVDNNAQVDETEPERTTAYNTRVRVYLPSTTGKSLVAYAYVSADRAITVYDSVDLTNRTPFSLEYIPGSAVLLRGHHSYPLSDEIIGSEGALIGMNKMNGILPPETNFSGCLIELKVRAVPQDKASQ
jgi:hypothetical protein